jgi:GTPase SAR1 family protein
VDHHGHSINFLVTDPGDLTEFESLTDFSIKCADAFVIQFSMTELSTLMAVQEFKEKILKMKDPNDNQIEEPVLLVGSKMDLVPALDEFTSILPLTIKGEMEKLGLTGFMEVNATDPKSLKDILLFFCDNPKKTIASLPK